MRPRPSRTGWSLLLAPLLLAGCDDGTSVEPPAVATGTPAEGDAAAAEPPREPQPGEKGYVAPHSTKPTPPLLQATSRGNLEAVKSLLADGGDPNVTHDSGIAPLHYAAGENMLEITRALLDGGADVSIRQAAGATPLLIACSVPDSIETVRLLLDRNADVNTADKKGNTPLVVASSNGFLDVVELLLARGAQVDAAVELGGTALHAAVIEGHQEVAAVLLASGAPVNAADKQKLTPLHHAARKGNRALCDFLLANGADPCAKSVEGGTAAQLAVFMEHEELAKHLQEIEVKACGNISTAEGAPAAPGTQKPALSGGQRKPKGQRKTDEAPK